MAAGRIFQGLNRAEVKIMLAHEVRDELTAKLLGYGDEDLDITFTYDLTLSAYPAETDEIRKTFKGRIAGQASAMPGSIADYVKLELDKDSTFAAHLTFPKVTWNWNIDLRAAREQVVEVAVPVVAPIVSADRHSLDLRPLSKQVLPDSQAQPADLAVLKDPHAEGIQRATARMLSTGVSERPTPVVDRRETEVATIRADQKRFEAEREAPSALENRLDRLEQMISNLVAGTTPRASEAAVDRALIITAPEAQRIAASRPHVVPNVRRMTPTGLEITGGAKVSPGADSAASWGDGVAVGQLTAVDHLAVDVAHPALDAGGAGAPDALRRQHQLPVPQPQEVTRDGRVITVADLPGVF